MKEYKVMDSLNQLKENLSKEMPEEQANGIITAIILQLLMR